MEKDEKFPAIAPFNATDRLILTPFPNGGWIITQGASERGFIDTNLGAYSNASDMLGALTGALLGAKHDRP